MDFEYEYLKFSFKTVFHLTPYSYRCCPCSYEFEYLEFLSDDGEINEPMYQNLLQTLSNKKCPHVEGVDAEFVKKTKCHGVHVVAALEDERVLKYIRDDNYHENDYEYGPSGLFGITPCHMAVLKGKPKSLEVMLDIYPYIRSDWSFKIWYRAEKDSNNIMFEESNFLEQCVRKNNPALLNSFIDWVVDEDRTDLSNTMGMDLSKAMNYAIMHEKTADMLNILMKNMEEFGCMNFKATFGDKHVIECAEIATILNEHDILEGLLETLSNIDVIEDIGPELPDLCIRLPRPKCKAVIEKYDICCKLWEPIEDTVHGLLETLVKYPYCATGYDEIVAILKSVPGIGAIINSEDAEGYTELQKFLKPKRYSETKRLELNPNPKIIGLLFDLGADVNKPFTNGESPLKFLLRERFILDDRMEYYMYKNVRQTIEMLLHENTSFEENDQDRDGSESITQLALQLDKLLIRRLRYGISGPFQLLEYHPVPIKMTNSVITDSHHTEGARYALNFLLPLLIECGYRASRAGLLKVDNERFALEEYEYIQRVLHANRPRDLTLICRDSLRKHFKGRKLWYYLERNHVPKRLKDFILVKHELLMLNGQ